MNKLTNFSELIHYMFILKWSIYLLQTRKTLFVASIVSKNQFILVDLFTDNIFSVFRPEIHQQIEVCK